MSETETKESLYLIIANSDGSTSKIGTWKPPEVESEWPWGDLHGPDVEDIGWFVLTSFQKGAKSVKVVKAENIDIAE